MSDDPVTSHRLQQLERGITELRQEDGEMRKEMSTVSSEVKLMAKAMADLTAQITTLVKQNAARDEARMTEMQEKVVQEGRFAKIELQLKILAYISGAIALGITGTLINSLMDLPTT